MLSHSIRRGLLMLVRQTCLFWIWKRDSYLYECGNLTPNKIFIILFTNHDVYKRIKTKYIFSLISSTISNCFKIYILIVYIFYMLYRFHAHFAKIWDKENHSYWHILMINNWNLITYIERSKAYNKSTDKFNEMILFLYHVCDICWQNPISWETHITATSFEVVI